ncbi:MAG TPA: hypothetical protein V6C81_07400 [Planktothrix sp.]
MLIGPHTVEFNANGFCIRNHETGRCILGDSKTAKIFYVDPKAKIFCPLDVKNISIFKYYYVNLNAGTFQDLRSDNLGKIEMLGRQGTKYGCIRSNASVKTERDYPVVICTIAGLEAPANLTGVLEYMYGMPDLSGFPVYINYSGSLMKTDKRLRTVSIQRTTDLNFQTTPNSGWKKVKDSHTIDVKMASSELYDSLLGPERR